MIKSPNPDYQFPSAPNVETRQSTNRLRDGRETQIAYSAPLSQVIQNVNPNPYAVAGNTVPGNQPFGMGFDYAEFPTPVDIVQYALHIDADFPMLYRSGLQSPRHETPNSRVFAPSVTTPSTNAATFIGNKKGDVYGS